jgi:hypothetical protein
MGQVTSQEMRGTLSGSRRPQIPPTGPFLRNLAGFNPTRAPGVN